MNERGERDLTLFLKAECIKVQNGIFMMQRVYATQVLELFGMLSCQHVSIMMLKKLKLLMDMGKNQSTQLTIVVPRENSCTSYSHVLIFPSL